MTGYTLFGEHVYGIPVEGKGNKNQSFQEEIKSLKNEKDEDLVRVIEYRMK